MGERVVSKFVLERGNYRFYTEKLESKYAVTYKMYHGKGLVETYSHDVFQAIYGADTQIALPYFAKEATDVLIRSLEDDEHCKLSYEYLVNLFNSYDNKKNPKMKDNSSFVKAVTTYSLSLSDAEDVEIDYCADYDFINGLHVKSVGSFDKSNVHSSSDVSYQHDYVYDDSLEKGRSRLYSQIN